MIRSKKEEIIIIHSRALQTVCYCVLTSQIFPSILFQALWLDYVDFARIRHVIEIQVFDWTSRMTSQTFPMRQNYKSLQEEVNPQAGKMNDY